jgi:hypothetical protein
MDSAFAIPGTSFRVGLDPLLGLILPGLGDVLGAFTSMLLVSLAVRQGVPLVIVLRMILNIAADALVGAVPFLGDIFDAAHRANEKNLALLEAYSDPRRRPSARDFIIAGLAVACVGALALVPLVITALILKMLFSG